MKIGPGIRGFKGPSEHKNLDFINAAPYIIIYFFLTLALRPLDP